LLRSAMRLKKSRNSAMRNFRCCPRTRHWATCQNSMPITFQRRSSC
jgi:hypothetical protein